MVDEDNRGAPEEPLPVLTVTGILGQVLVSSSDELREARDRCGPADCVLGPDRFDTFLALDAFGEPDGAPTVADIDGLVVLEP
jgi:hypothetical protein